jgi:hypothetical protein
MTDEIRIALEPEDTLVSFSHKVAEALFESMRKEITALDAATEPFIAAKFGEDKASFLLLVLGHLAGDMTRYAAYMAAGIYMCAGTGDEEENRETAKGCVKALLRDQKKAAQLGLLAAEIQADGVIEQMDVGKDMLADLLKKHKGAQH